MHYVRTAFKCNVMIRGKLHMNEKARTANKRKQIKKCFTAHNARCYKPKLGLHVFWQFVLIEDDEHFVCKPYYTHTV